METAWQGTFETDRLTALGLRHCCWLPGSRISGFGFHWAARRTERPVADDQYISITGEAIRSLALLTWAGPATRRSSEGIRIQLRRGTGHRLHTSDDRTRSAVEAAGPGSISISFSPVCTMRSAKNSRKVGAFTTYLAGTRYGGVGKLRQL